MKRLIKPALFGASSLVASACIVIPLDPPVRSRSVDASANTEIADAAVVVTDDTTFGSSSAETRHDSSRHSGASNVSDPSSTSSSSTRSPDETRDAGSDTGDAFTSDAPDACASYRAESDVGVFVSPTGADADGCGEAAFPCRTVAVAVQRATELNHTRVYLERGAYAEAVVLDVPVSLIGGFTRNAGEWVQGCGALAATTVLDSPSSIGLRAEFSGSATLQGLTIRSIGRAEQANGESRYGVYANGAETVLEVHDITILPGDANHGAPGIPGGTLPLDPSCPSGDGSVGAPAAATPASPSGGFTDTGYQTRDGAVGPNGNPGSGGRDGAASSNSDCITTCRDQFDCDTETLTAAGGVHGCGGPAGGGGSGGGGGGASIGIFAWLAKVQLGERVTVITGDAGDGGVGGDGGLGRDGDPGTDGGSATCRLPGNDQIELTGETGTPGGRGSDGAKGGDGAGGWVVALVSTPGSFNDASHTDLRLGTPGSVGAPTEGEAEHIIELHVE